MLDHLRTKLLAFMVLFVGGLALAGCSEEANDGDVTEDDVTEESGDAM